MVEPPKGDRSGCSAASVKVRLIRTSVAGDRGDGLVRQLELICGRNIAAYLGVGAVAGDRFDLLVGTAGLGKPAGGGFA
jgi:hypothetical protein